MPRSAFGALRGRIGASNLYFESGSPCAARASNCCQRFHIPLDWLHANGAYGVDGAVIIVAVRQADQGGSHAGDGLDFVVAGVQVGHHLVCG